MDELHHAFEMRAKKEGVDPWILSAAVSAAKFRITEGYEVGANNNIL